MDTRTAAKQDFIPLMRELVRTYQAFASFDAAGYRDVDLTVPQADVIFTLGNTEGMTFGEIGKKTLITKGTLTGVVDRLERKGLVERVAHPGDRRCTQVSLTTPGEKVFDEMFPRQILRLKARFDRLSKSERRETLACLRRLKGIF